MHSVITSVLAHIDTYPAEPVSIDQFKQILACSSFSTDLDRDKFFKILKHVSITPEEEQREPLLFQAIAAVQETAVRWMLEAGFDPHITDELERNVLYAVAILADEKTANELMDLFVYEHGVNVNVHFYHDYFASERISLLNFAVMQSDTNIVSTIARNISAQGASAFFKVKRQLSSALVEACKSQKDPLPKMCVLLQHGAELLIDTFCETDSYETFTFPNAFHAAAKARNSLALHLLINEALKSPFKDDIVARIDEYFADNQRVVNVLFLVLEALTENNKDINFRNQQQEIIQGLAELGSRSFFSTIGDRPILVHALKTGDIEIVRICLQRISVAISRSLSPFITRRYDFFYLQELDFEDDIVSVAALDCRDSNILCLLLAELRQNLASCAVNKRLDVFGTTLLMALIKDPRVQPQEKREKIRILIQAGANVNSKDIKGHDSWYYLKKCKFYGVCSSEQRAELYNLFFPKTQRTKAPLLFSKCFTCSVLIPGYEESSVELAAGDRSPLGATMSCLSLTG